MASFAFLPRSVKVKQATANQKRVLKPQDYPRGIILRVELTTSSSDFDIKTLTSACEKLVPRSCQYVHFDGKHDDLVFIRTSTRSKAKHLTDKLQNNQQFASVQCKSASILDAQNEEQYWAKIPLRVKHRVEKQVAAIKLKRRRGNQSRKLRNLRRSKA